MAKARKKWPRPGVMYSTEGPLKVDVLENGHSLRFTLPLMPPSKNGLRKLPPGIVHTVVSKLGKDAEAMMGSLLMPFARSFEKATGKRVVSFQQFRARQLDTGNQEQAMVGIQDALTRLGLIKDDAPEWADITYCPTIGGTPKKDRRLEITISVPPERSEE